MASQLLITNRQRRVKLDTKWFKKAAVQLFAGTLDNLKKRPAPFIKDAKRKKLQESAHLSVVIVSNKEIQKLNNKWRGKNYATDVLSFPLEEEESFMDLGLPFEIGELIISAEKAVEQAEEYGHSLERELSFLFVHGLLHILGFDHESKEGEKDMFSRQKEILSACGYTR